MLSIGDRLAPPHAPTSLISGIYNNAFLRNRPGNQAGKQATLKP